MLSYTRRVLVRQPLVKGKKSWVDSDKLFGSLGVRWHQNEKNPVDFKLNYICEQII